MILPKCLLVLTGGRMKNMVTPPTSGTWPMRGSRMTLSIPLSCKIQDRFYLKAKPFKRVKDEVNAEIWNMTHSLEVLWHQLRLAPAPQRQCPRHHHSCKMKSGGGEAKRLWKQTSCMPTRLLLFTPREKPKHVSYPMTTNVSNPPYVHVQDHLLLIHFFSVGLHPSDPERLES